MTKLLAVFIAFGLFAGSALAQTEQKQTAAPAPAKQDKKKDKKDKKSSGQQDLLNTEIFSERVANDVLNQLRDGLEGHVQRAFLSAFDSFKMDGFLQFEDQIEAYFNRYDGFRVQFTIAQTTVEGPKGIVLVNARLEQSPRGGGSPVQKSGQLRFEIERGKKGWKIVNMSDRGFFS